MATSSIGARSLSLSPSLSLSLSLSPPHPPPTPDPRVRGLSKNRKGCSKLGGGVQCVQCVEQTTTRPVVAEKVESVYYSKKTERKRKGALLLAPETHLGPVQRGRDCVGISSRAAVCDGGAPASVAVVGA